MANPGDILAPKLLQDGTFEEVVVTPALIAAAALVNGLVPTTQLPPLSFQTTRYEGNGTTSAFAPPGVLTNADSPSAISVTINGVVQEPGVDYTLDVENNRIVLDAPLPSGDKIVLTRPILLPSNTTLTAEQIGAIPASALAAETQSRQAADAAIQGTLTAIQSSLPSFSPRLAFVAEPLPSNTFTVSLQPNRFYSFTKTLPNDYAIRLPQSPTNGDRLVVTRNGNGSGVLDIQRDLGGSWFTIISLRANQTARLTYNGTSWTVDHLSHASTHATGGTDPLTPADIGAASSAHGHSYSAEIMDALLEDPPACRAALEAASEAALASLEARVASLEARVAAIESILQI